MSAHECPAMDVRTRASALCPVSSLRTGQHLCTVHRTDEARDLLLSEFIQRGLAAGERVLCISENGPEDPVFTPLRNAELDVRAAVDEGRLQFILPNDAYLRHGVFDPGAMIERLREQTQQALDDGLTGLRVAGEMSWALRGSPGSERLIEYESLLNRFLPESACIGLCQYDMRRFPSSVLLDVLRTHPVAILDTCTYENPFYIPRGEMLSGRSDDSTLSRWITSLEQSHRLAESLRDRAETLKERVKELECLQRVRELTSENERTVPELLAALLEAIRGGWRRPDRLHVRIEHRGQSYATPGFSMSERSLEETISVHGRIVGRITVVSSDASPDEDLFLPEERTLLHAIADRLSHTLTARHDLDQLQYINSVLRAIRNVNQLIVRETDRQALIQQACELIVDARGFVCAWIVLLDDHGQPKQWAGTGGRDAVETLISSWRQDGPPRCAAQALTGDAPVFIERVQSTCPDCPMAVRYGPSLSASVRLAHEGAVYGVLTVGAPAVKAEDPEAARLLREVAGDLAYALAAIQSEETLRESEERFRSLYENTSLGLYRTTPEGRILMANPALVQMLGYESFEELVERNLSQAGYEPAYDRESFQEQVEQDGSVRSLDSAWSRKDGSTLFVRESARAVRDPAGRVLYYDGTVEDVTELVTAKAREKQHLRLMTMAGEIARLGGWSADLKENRVNWSGEVAAIHEMEAGFSPTLEEGIAFYAPEYRARIREAFSACAEKGIPYDEELQIVTRTGRRVWVRTIGEPVRDSTSQIIAVQGAFQDITEKRCSADVLQKSESRYRKLSEGLTLSMTTMTELRDPYTAGHQQRVTELAVAIADRLALPEKARETVRIAALLHDIGKAAVPAEILNRPSQLSELEFSIIKGHPRTGYDVLRKIPFELPVADVVWQHHERLDGSGYPSALVADEILIEARILAIADVVEAMASHRPYRAALGINAALEEIATQRGVLYDTAAVDTCITLFGEGFTFSEGAWSQGAEGEGAA
jgi:PAS domain S-box-containing protein/putative nucleotidyltransferase with HDIG domain